MNSCSMPSSPVREGEDLRKYVLRKQLSMQGFELGESASDFGSIRESQFSSVYGEAPPLDDEDTTPTCCRTAPENPSRDKWACPAEFLLASIAFCVGVGNFWAFEYNLWFTGGGSFFVPYTMLMLICGYPLLVLEMTLGQFISGNPLTVWRVVPCMKGIGYCMLVSCIIKAIHRNSVLSWHLYYVYSSLNVPLPWIGCNNTWNTNDCSPTDFVQNCSTDYNGAVSDTSSSSSLCHNTTLNNSSFVSPAQEYFHRFVLDMSDGLHDLTGVRWGILLCTLIVWVATVLGLIKGIKSMTKVIYVTLSLAAVILVVLIVRVCLVEGSLDGVYYYVIPQFSFLKDYKVWYAACVQMFFTLSPGFGVYIVLAGHNDFHYNYKRWAVLISAVSVLTSFLIGFLIFALLGALSHQLNAPIQSLIVTGYDLCYIVLPQALSILPLPQIWSSLFYLMLFLLGFGGQMPLVETLIRTFIDQWPFETKGGPHRPALLAWTCSAMFFVGIVFTNRGSIYVMVLMEGFGVHWSCLLLSMVSAIVLCSIYGFQRVGSAVDIMLGYRLSDWWKFVWKFGVPFVVLFTFVCDSLRNLSLTYGNYVYPDWSFGVGFVVSLGPFLLVPAYFLFKLVKTSGGLKERWSQMSKPPSDWGPVLESHKFLLVSELPDYVKAEPEPDFTDFCSKDSTLTLDSAFASDRSLHSSRVNGFVSNGRINWADDLDTGSVNSDEEENTERGNWMSRAEFLLTCLGYSVGLGNVWRFPFLVYRNGGGAFFIPYVIMMIFMGWPLYYLELILGQYSSRGPTTVWACVPLLRGLGFTMVFAVAVLGVYYNIIISWTVYYLFASMTDVLPWSGCNNTWNTANCSDEMYSPDEKLNVNSTTDSNFTSGRRSPSEEYYSLEVLGMSAGISEIGSLRWHLSLCLALAWICVFLCIIRGIKSVGKVAYIMATFPYVILTILMIRAFTLDGYLEGIQYYVTPNWSKLGEGGVWYDAAVQVLFSLSTCYGGIIMLASYNHFHNNCSRDAFYLAFGDFATSAFSGFVIFALLGVMAKSFNTSVENVITSETGLAFIAFPDAVNRLPISPLWSFLFFIMLFLLGLDTQMVSVEVMTVCIVEEFPQLFKKKVWVSLVLCVWFYVLGLPLVTDGGSYILVLLDNYIASWPILILAVLEPLGVAWLYGFDRLGKDMKSMMNVDLSLWWKTIWGVVSPLIIVCVLIFKVVQYELPMYDSYEYPDWAHYLGWVLVVISLLPIPICALYAVCNSKAATLKERWRASIAPARDYGPMLDKHRQYAAYFQPELIRYGSNSSTTASAPSDMGGFSTANSPFSHRRHDAPRDLNGYDVITSSPKRLGDLKNKLNEGLLEALASEGHDDDTWVQKRPTKRPPVRDIQTQTVLTPIDEETNEVLLHSPPPGYNEVVYPSVDDQDGVDSQNETHSDDDDGQIEINLSHGDFQHSSSNAGNVNNSASEVDVGIRDVTLSESGSDDLEPRIDESSGSDVNAPSVESELNVPQCQILNPLVKNHDLNGNRQMKPNRPSYCRTSTPGDYDVMNNVTTSTAGMQTTYL